MTAWILLWNSFEGLVLVESDRGLRQEASIRRSCSACGFYPVGHSELAVRSCWRKTTWWYGCKVGNSVECQVRGRLVDRKLTLLVVKLRPDQGRSVSVRCDSQ
jgi:hypothetical protein